ncbi:hypothetical protein [Azospirillum sp. sgz302134]
MTTMRDTLQRFLAGGQDRPPTPTDKAEPATGRDETAPTADRAPETRPTLLDRPLSPPPEPDAGPRVGVSVPAAPPPEPQQPEPVAPPPRAPKTETAPTHGGRETKEQRRIRVLEQHLADALTYIDELEERLRDLGEEL